jgi:hypothetical protein
LSGVTLSLSWLPFLGCWGFKDQVWSTISINLSVMGHYSLVRPIREICNHWWSSGKGLGPRGLFPLWSQVQALWLLIWWPLEVYMVVNFRARRISWGACKLARTSTLN